MAYSTNLIIDSDGDGLIDPVEVGLGLDPYNADSDSDGQSDYNEVMLVDLDFVIYLTDGDNNVITDFDVIFTKKRDEGCQLVATNPGQFFYLIEIRNTWDRPIINLSVDLKRNPDFIFQGTNPIIIYMDGIDITNQTLIEGDTIFITNIPMGSLVKIASHLDYGLKGAIYPSIDEYQLKSHIFIPTIIATQELEINYYYNEQTSLIGYKKKSTAIAGYITDINGLPLSQVVVELYDALGNLIAHTLTDENGFYYFINLDVGLFTIKVVYNNQPYSLDVITTKDELISKDFQVT